MGQKQTNTRTIWFILATLAVMGLIAALFISNFRQSQRDGIVLPDASQSQPAETQPTDAQQPSMLEVTRENVQNIVRYLRRPQYYHQTYTITRQMRGAASVATAELWVSDTHICAILDTGAAQKYILTDGQTRYVWYAGDTTARQLSAAPDMTMDELTGILTYEQVITLPEDQITDGEFIADDRFATGQQVFLAAEQQSMRREYWISLDYGLLTQGIVKSGGETIYDAQQSSLEILAAGDEAFDNVFVLPDGSSPF